MDEQTEYDDAAMEELIQLELDALDETDLEVEDDISDLEEEQKGDHNNDDNDDDNEDEERIDPCMSEYLSLIKTYNDKAIQKMAEAEDIINAVSNINFNMDELLKEKLYEQLDDVDKDKVMLVLKEVRVDIDLQELEDENGVIMNEDDDGSTLDVIKVDNIQEIQEIETNARKALQQLLKEQHLTAEKNKLLEEEKKKEAEKFDVLTRQRREAKMKELEDLHVIFEKDNNILDNILQVNEVIAYEQDMKEKLEMINRNCSAEKGRLESLQDEIVQITTMKKNWAATMIQKYFKRYIVRKTYASDLMQINEKMLLFRKDKVNNMIKEQERVQAEYKQKQEDELKKKEKERLEKEKNEKEKEERKRKYEEQKTILIQERAKKEQEEKQKHEEEQMRKKENEKLKKKKKKEPGPAAIFHETTALVTYNDIKGRETIPVVETHGENILAEKSDKCDSSENSKSNASDQSNSQNNSIYQEKEMNSQVLKTETQLNFQIEKNNTFGEKNSRNNCLTKKEKFPLEQNVQDNSLDHDCDSLPQVPLTQDRDDNSVTDDSNSVTQGDNSITEDSNSVTQGDNSITEDSNSVTQGGNSQLIQLGNSLTQDDGSVAKVDAIDKGNIDVDFPHVSKNIVIKSEMDKKDVSKRSNDTFLNEDTFSMEKFSSHVTHTDINTNVSDARHGITDSSTSHCELASDIVILSSNLSNLDVKEEENSGTCFGVDNSSPPLESVSGGRTEREDNVLDTNEKSLNDMIERISAKRKDRHTKRLAVHAIKIQSVYRGYRVRKAYKQLKQLHCGNESSGDSDHSESLYDEVNLEEFELNDSVMEWTAPTKPQLPSEELPLPNIPATVQIPVKEAWCPLDSRVELHSSCTQAVSLTEKSPSRNRSIASSCKTSSKKVDKINDEWGFQNEATAELMLKRAKKLGTGKKKKINSSQRYQSFKDTESTSTLQTKHISPGRKKAPERISYFQASSASPLPLDQKQQLESREATYKWVCNQPVLHGDRALEVMSRNAKYFTEDTAVQNKHPNLHGIETILLPQIDPAILAGKPLSLVQSKVHNPKPPCNARTSAGSEKGRKNLLSPQKKSHSAPIQDPNLKKLSSITSNMEEKWTHCAYR